MVITRIVKRKNKRRLFTVFIDESASFDVSDSVLLQYGLRTGDSIDGATIAAVKASELQKEVQLVAVNYISYRPRSSREVLDHLTRKGFPRTLSEGTVHHLESIRLINNLEFARMFVRDKLRRKPIGRSLLQRFLAAKGIPAPIADQVLRETISDEEQKKAAQELASKRIRLTRRSMSKLDVLRQKQRLTGYLLRRGFSGEIVQNTIQALFRS